MQTNAILNADIEKSQFLGEINRQAVHTLQQVTSNDRSCQITHTLQMSFQRAVAK